LSAKTTIYQVTGHHPLEGDEATDMAANSSLYKEPQWNPRRRQEEVAAIEHHIETVSIAPRPLTMGTEDIEWVEKNVGKYIDHKKIVNTILTKAINNRIVLKESDLNVKVGLEPSRAHWVSTG